MTRKLTPAQVAEACRRYVAGESTPMLGQAYGVTGGAIAGLLRNRDIPRRSDQRKLTAAGEADLCRLYAAGTSYDDLRCQFGVSNGTIKNITQRHGIRRNREVVARLTPDQRAIVKSRYEAGLTMVQVADELGVGPSAVWTALHRTGVSMRSRVSRIPDADADAAWRQCKAGGFTKSFVARFWAKVDKTSSPHGCWLWTASLAHGGYGHMGVGGRSSMIIRAHRASWLMLRGPIPDGLLVCHDCPGGDNPRCVNPEHCFLGTKLDNHRDMTRKGRARATPSLGEANGFAKLTDAAVLAIKCEHREGASYRDLAERHGVKLSTIGRVVRQEGWKHVR